MRATAEQRTHNLKIEERRISIKYGLSSRSSRIVVGLPLKLLSYVKAVSAAFKGRGVQMVFTLTSKKPYEGEELPVEQSGLDC